MGDAVIEGSNWRLVEVGRVVVINGDHPFAGRLATIVEIIDHKRVGFPAPDQFAEIRDIDPVTDSRRRSFRER
jgi:large subunit ribosomal protein L14e